MKEVTANCYINGKTTVTVLVPDNYSEDEIYEDIERSLDLGELEYNMTDVDIDISLIRNSP